MKSMFQFCNKLTDLNLSSFNTGNVTDMSWMFGDCKNLNNLDISNFNTEKVIEMKCMFCNCIKLDNLNFSFLNVKKVKNASGIFFGCQKKIIDSNKVKFQKFKINDLTSIKQIIFIFLIIIIFLIKQKLQYVLLVSNLYIINLFNYF